MSYKIGTAANVPDLLAQLNSFLTVGHSLEPSYTGTGTGTITDLLGGSGSVLEVITVTLTDATHFSVDGSLSGHIGSGTAGVAFASAICNFTLTTGSAPWVAADTVVFTMTPPWVALRATSSEFIWKAPGNDNAQAIYVGVTEISDLTADMDILRLGGFIGFNGANTFANQPGALTSSILPLMRVGAMPFWFIANGRRVIILAKCSTVYEAAYLGYLQQYPPPSAFPYPLCICGSLSFVNEPTYQSTAWRWSYQGAEHTLLGLFGNSTQTFPACIRRPDGIWRGLSAYTAWQGGLNQGGYVWPMAGGGPYDLRPNLDGSYALLPVIFSEDYGQTLNDIMLNPNIFGELDGVFSITGYSNSAENIVTIGRTQYVVVQNVFRNTKSDFVALYLV